MPSKYVKTIFFCFRWGSLSGESRSSRRFIFCHRHLRHLPGVVSAGRHDGDPGAGGEQVQQQAGQAGEARQWLSEQLRHVLQQTVAGAEEWCELLPLLSPRPIPPSPSPSLHSPRQSESIISSCSSSSFILSPHASLNIVFLLYHSSSKRIWFKLWRQF